MRLYMTWSSHFTVQWSGYFFGQLFPAQRKNRSAHPVLTVQSDKRRFVHFTLLNFPATGQRLSSRRGRPFPGPCTTPPQNDDHPDSLQSYFATIQLRFTPNCRLIMSINIANNRACVAGARTTINASSNLMFRQLGSGYSSSRRTLSLYR